MARQQGFTSISYSLTTVSVLLIILFFRPLINNLSVLTQGFLSRPASWNRRSLSWHSCITRVWLLVRAITIAFGSGKSEDSPGLWRIDYSRPWLESAVVCYSLLFSSSICRSSVSRLSWISINYQFSYSVALKSLESYKDFNSLEFIKRFIFVLNEPQHDHLMPIRFFVRVIY